MSIFKSHEILKIKILNFTLEYNFLCTHARIQRSGPNPCFRIKKNYPTYSKVLKIFARLS